MSEIPDIQIKGIEIQSQEFSFTAYPVFSTPDIPVSVPIGFPIIEMPCVTTRRAEYENSALIDNDPKGNVVLCPGGVPSYQAMDFTPNEFVYAQEDQPQRFQEPETPPTSEPPPTPQGTDCPPVDAAEIGSKVPTSDGKGQQEITGYQLVGNRCVTQYKDVPLAEQIAAAIPSAPQVVTTASIAIVATAAAASTPLLLRIVRPLVKQVIKRVQKLLGRKTKILSTRERILNQRELTIAIRTLKKMKK